MRRIDSDMTKRLCRSMAEDYHAIADLLNQQRATMTSNRENLHQADRPLPFTPAEELLQKQAFEHLDKAITCLKATVGLRP